MSKKVLKVLASSALALALTVSAVPTLASYAVDGETGDSVYVPTDEIVDIDIEKVFNSWVNYPGEEFGSAYSAGWKYDSTEKYLNTTENVGWTGFYNPDITNFTSGIFGFKMQNKNFDPCGFAWGIRVGGTEEDPIYSFYAFEECEYSTKWSVAYISEWHPAKNTGMHRGPLYHATIDAADGQYNHTGSKGSCGFAEGEVLAYGTLPTDIKKEFHDVVIEVEETQVKIYINSELLTTVETDVQSGSFDPFATSNPSAYFSNLSFTSTDIAVLNPQFEYQNAEGTAVEKVYEGDTVVVADKSTYEGSPISKYLWTVTLNGEEIYSGETPYTEYTKQVGEYVTSLQLTNEYGIKSSVYSLPLLVEKIPNTITPEFTYAVKNGDTVETIEKATVGDDVSVVDASTYTGSPIAAYQWTVTLNGEQIYDGAEPFANYGDKAGEYVTSLLLTNEDGEKSEVYSATLTVEEVSEPIEESSEEESSKEEPVEEPSKEESQSSENFATGDNTFASFWSMIAASLTGLALFVFASKKTDKSKK